MRLINTITLQVAGPFLGSEMPPYAILSHTWGDDELSLQGFASYRQQEHKKGFLKIRSCCARALRDGYIYAWIDTVCIDKTSSAELSEAINSMYDWYSKAAVCYAYLEDLPSEKGSMSLFSDLKLCRWFTRGWTLQELMAPKKMIFFNKNWDEVGDKKGLSHQIGQTTGIDCGCLLGNPIRAFSIADRMSWASKRETTRPEDLAYCLLGIFGINMPMLYGEGGQRAFFRLQQEILRKFNDQSIFAWSSPQCHGLGMSTVRNLLAPSPAFFDCRHSFIPARTPGDSNDYSVTSRGISFKVLSNQSRNRVILKCRRAGSHGLCWFPVRRLRTGPNEYGRTGCGVAEIQPHQLSEDLEEITITLRTDIYDSLDFYRENKVNYLAIARLPAKSSGYFIAECCPGDSYDYASASITITPFVGNLSGTVFSFRHRERSGTSFFVALFCFGDLENQDCMGTEKDFIGVYDNPSERDAVHFFRNFLEWFQMGRVGDLPSAAKRVFRDGLEVWTLGDGQFVHVAVSRHLNPALGYVGCARVLAGRSWEHDIERLADWGPFENSSY